MDKSLLRAIPKVDELLSNEALAGLGASAVTLTEAVRATLDALRAGILSGEVTAMPSTEELCGAVRARVEKMELPSLRGVINATGVVLHTNTMADLDYDVYDAAVEWMQLHGEEDI